MSAFKTKPEIEKIRATGKILARIVRQLEESIVPGKTTPADLDALAMKLVEEAGATSSTVGYRGYPAATCISVNDTVIHGIPTKIPLMEGDIVDIDVAICYQGWHADTARTVPVGTISPEAQRLLNVTRESMVQGIAKARVGGRMEDIGSAVQRYVESHGYSVVRDLVGHGIGRSLHEEPSSVPNFGKAGKGIPLKEGMVMCIEPMVNQGTYRVNTLSDGWTIKTADGKLSAHFEHTVALTKEGPDILTLE